MFFRRNCLRISRELLSMIAHHYYRYVRAPFNNMRIFSIERFWLPSIILISGRPRKQKFNSAGSKGHVRGLWLVDFDLLCLLIIFRLR